MKKNSIIFLAIALSLVWSSPTFAAQVVFGDTDIDADGISGGVEFATDSTLTVPDGTDVGSYSDIIFGFPINYSTFSDAPNTGTLTFEGSSLVPSVINGNGVRLKALNAGATGTEVDISFSPFHTYVVTTNVGSDGTVTDGTGTLALNGGDLIGTTVNFGGDGTITLAANSDISAAITNTTTNNGTLTLANGSHSLSGNIGSTGVGLKQITLGTGTTAVDGDIKASNLNFAADGIMSLTANSDVTGAITNTTTNEGTLTLANGAHSLTGNIGSTGSGLKLISIGTGTTSVNGDILATRLNFTGDGVLSMASGSDLTVGASNFTNTTDSQGTITFAGTSVTSGSGTIGVAGTGDLLAVNVSGALSLGNDMAAITTTVNNGGTLSIAANRLITGNLALTDAGAGLATLSLGTSTLTLAGTSIFTTTAGGGNEIIATTASSSSTFGKIVATGNASIEAGTTIDVTVAGSLTPGTAMKILDAGAAGSNVAVTVTDNSARYDFTGSMASGDISITPTTTTSTIATSPNNANVAAALDSTLGVATGDMATVQNALSSLSTSSELDSAVGQLDPVVSEGYKTASFNSVTESINALKDHLAEVRITPTPPTTIPDKPTIVQNGVSTGDTWKNKGAWVKAFGSHANQGTRNGIDGFKAYLWGITGGLDGEVAVNTRLGFAGTYASTNVDNKGQGGGTDVNSYQGTLYLSYDDPSPWYANAGFTFGWNSYGTTRRISFSTITRTAHSDYDGQQYTVFGDVGYVMKHKQFEITPIASLVYSHLALDGYTETQAGDLNLSVRSQSYDLLQSGLGIQLARLIVLKNGTWTPEIHAKWLYDFIGDPVQTNSTFTGGGSSFATNGASPAQHSFNLGTGITYYSKGNLTLSGTYDLEVKEDYTSHTGQGILRYDY